MRLLLSIAALMLLVSCTTIVRSEAELHFRKHPELKARYARFSPTDARSVEECAEMIYTTRMHFVEARKKEGADAERLADMTRMAKQWYEEKRKLAASLRDAAERTGGQIYKYEIQQVPQGEGGYVIVRDGEIVERVGGSTWTNHE